jgi:hypothetical protein
MGINKMKRKNVRTSKGKSPEMAQENIPVLITRPWSSFVFMSILVTMNFVVQLLDNWRILFLYAQIGFSILALLMPWIAAFIYKKFQLLFSTLENMVDLPSEQIITWFGRQVNFIFGGSWIYIISIPFGVAGLLTMLYLGLPWSQFINFIFAVFWGAFMLATGIVGWIYLGLLFFLYRLSRLKIKGTPFEWPDKEFKDIGTTYIQIFMPGVILYVGIVLALWASGQQWMALAHPLGRLWTFPMAGAVIGFFLTSQYFIHRSMVSSKQSRLDAIDQLLKETYQCWFEDRSTEQAKTITELMTWRNYINTEREWPFNLQSNFAIVSGLLLPTIKTIIDFIPR